MRIDTRRFVRVIAGCVLCTARDMNDAASVPRQLAAAFAAGALGMGVQVCAAHECIVRDVAERMAESNDAPADGMTLDGFAGQAHRFGKLGGHGR